MLKQLVPENCSCRIWKPCMKNGSLLKNKPAFLGLAFHCTLHIFFHAYRTCFKCLIYIWVRKYWCASKCNNQFFTKYRAIYYEECVSIFGVIKFLKPDVPFISLLWLMFYIRSHWYVYIYWFSVVDINFIYLKTFCTGEVCY